MRLNQILVLIRQNFQTLKVEIAFRINQNGKNYLSRFLRSFQQELIVVGITRILEKDITSDQLDVRVLQDIDNLPKHISVPTWQFQYPMTGVIYHYVNQVRRYFPFSDQAIPQSDELINNLVIPTGEGVRQE